MCSKTLISEKARCPVRIEWLRHEILKKQKFVPGFEPGPLGQNANALPLATMPPRPYSSDQVLTQTQTTRTRTDLAFMIDTYDNRVRVVPTVSYTFVGFSFSLGPVTQIIPYLSIYEPRGQCYKTFLAVNSENLDFLQNQNSAKTLTNDYKHVHLLIQCK